MSFEESKRYPLGKKKCNYYDEQLLDVKQSQDHQKTLMHVLKADQLPWEKSRQGKLKHLINRKMDTVMKGIEAYIQELPPGGHSGKHRHMGEEVLFILEGKGHDMHWDVDVEIQEKYIWKVDSEGKRFDWEESDIVYIPPNTVHQHFNDDLRKPARFISAMSSIYNSLGYNDVEQIEDASKT